MGKSCVVRHANGNPRTESRSSDRLGFAMRTPSKKTSRQRRQETIPRADPVCSSIRRRTDAALGQVKLLRERSRPGNDSKAPEFRIHCQPLDFGQNASNRVDSPRIRSRTRDGVARSRVTSQHSGTYDACNLHLESHSWRVRTHRVARPRLRTSPRKPRSNGRQVGLGEDVEQESIAELDCPLD